MTTLNTPTTLADLTTTYREPGYLHRLSAMLRGLRKPRNSREYKAARIELERLSAPATALLLPALMVCLLTVMSESNMPDDRLIDVTIIGAEAPEKEWLKPDAPETAEPTAEDTFTIDIPSLTPSVKAEADTPSPPISPRLIPVDAEPVWRGRRPVTFIPYIGAQRTTGARAELRKQYDGGAATETAVMRALRWLKKNQQSDGSWKNQKIAMTGLAVLTFLAHGEKPGDSPEFGESVRRALEFLMRSQKPADHQQGGGTGRCGACRNGDRHQRYPSHYRNLVTVTHATIRHFTRRGFRAMLLPYERLRPRTGRPGGCHRGFSGPAAALCRTPAEQRHARSGCGAEHAGQARPARTARRGADR